MIETALGIPVLYFAAGLPGFPAARRFVLVDPHEGDGLYRLRCLDDPALEFVVAVPAAYFPDYAPEIDDATLSRLGLRAAEEALLLVIVSVGASPAGATANLLAPVVISNRTRRGAQAVLPAGDYAVDTPLTHG